MGVPRCKKKGSESQKYREGFAKGNGDVLYVFYTLMREVYEWDNEHLKEFADYVFHHDVYEGTKEQAKAFDVVKPLIKANGFDVNKGITSPNDFTKGKTMATYYSLVILFSVLILREKWEESKIADAINKFFEWYKVIKNDPKCNFSIRDIEKILKKEYGVVISRCWL